jgi:hypothetical protein
MESGLAAAGARNMAIGALVDGTQAAVPGAGGMTQAG